MSAASITARSAIPRRCSRRPRARRSSMWRASPSPTARAFWCRENSPIRTIADLKGKRIGFTKGSSAHNVVVQTLEKAGPRLCRYHAGLSDAAGCGPRLRQWQHRGLGDLGSVFRHRRDQAERPHPGQCARDHQDQFLLHRQPRFRARTTGLFLQQIIDVTTSTARWAETHRDEVAKSLRRRHRHAAGHPDHCRQPLVVRDRPDH